MIATLCTLYVLLTLGALLQAPPAARRLGLAGLVPFAVALVSYGVNPGSADPQVIAAAARASGSAFFSVNTGLLAFGTLLAAAVALGTLREDSRSLRTWALLAASAVALWQLRPLVAASGAVRVGLVVVTGAAILGVIAILPGRLPRSVPQGSGTFDWVVLRGHPALSALFVVGAAGVGLGPHVGLVFAGLMAAVAADYLARRARGHAGLPWLPAVTLGLLPVWWLLATIAGPVGLRVATLGDVPLSPRAEILLALPLALVAWSCLGLWPAHRLFPGGLLAPLGVALWLRVARPALPDGLDHWQPVVMPLGALGVWGGALLGRSPAALNALAFVALAGGTRDSGVAAILLAVAALGLAVANGSGVAAPLRGLTRRLAWAVALLTLPLVLEAGFRRQISYTLAVAAGVTVMVWLGLGPGRNEEAVGRPDADAAAT